MSSKREMEGMHNLAKTGSLYKNDPKGAEPPKQDTPVKAANQPPEHK